MCLSTVCESIYGMIFCCYGCYGMHTYTYLHTHTHIHRLQPKIVDITWCLCNFKSNYQFQFEYIEVIKEQHVAIP